jgi:hypothetical protein
MITSAFIFTIFMLILGPIKTVPAFFVLTQDQAPTEACDLALKGTVVATAVSLVISLKACFLIAMAGSVLFDHNKPVLYFPDQFPSHGRSLRRLGVAQLYLSPSKKGPQPLGFFNSVLRQTRRPRRWQKGGGCCLSLFSSPVHGGDLQRTLNTSDCFAAKSNTAKHGHPFCVTGSEMVLLQVAHLMRHGEMRRIYARFRP